MLDEAKDIRIGEELDQNALNNYLLGQIEGFSEIIEIKQFPGGYSNLTYLLRTKDTNYVLRKPPKGSKAVKGGHNIGREFQILKSLEASGFDKIPKPIFYTNDESVLSSEFYIMEKLDGVIFRSSELQQQKEFLKPDLMSNLSKRLCETQVALHKVKISNTPLQNIGKPEGYIHRQIKGWHERYITAMTEDIEIEIKIYHWLEENLPLEIAPTLLHNDFKYDNVIFDLDKLDILGILDWEMTTIGDPRMDLGTTLSYWCEYGDGSFEKNFNLSWLPGNLTRDEYVVYYSNLNPDVDLSNILYFYVFGLFKNAIIIQQIYGRYHRGQTTDKRFANLNLGVQVLLQKAYQSIQQNRML
jgi:aminoglycoside phosphotransferase (APT) family kinase protein